MTSSPALRPLVHIPDDAPAVMGRSPSFTTLQAQAEVRHWDTLPGDGLLERVRDAEVIINIRSSSRFTSELLAACPRLKMISIWGTGTDNVDLGAAARLGITVTNTPGVAAISIAEHCLMLMFAVARKIVSVDAQVRAGDWPKAQASQLHGKTLGVVGLGAIGRQFARLGQAIGMKTITWTMHPNPALGFEHVELGELYRRSDVVSLHLRLSPQTVGMFGREELALLKPTGIFLNTARGGLVDEAALVDALATGRLAGAGLDVFAVEPLPPDSPLRQLTNVILTPHSAGITPETVEAGLRLAIENVMSWSAGSPQHVVA